MLNKKDDNIGKQMTDCDIIFMIPGRMSKDVKQLYSVKNEDGETFIKAIEDSMDEELNESTRMKSLINPSEEYKSRFTVLKKEDETEVKEKKFLWFRKKEEIKKQRVTVKSFDRSCLGSCILHTLV